MLISIPSWLTLVTVSSSIMMMSNSLRNRRMKKRLMTEIHYLMIQKTGQPVLEVLLSVHPCMCHLKCWIRIWAALEWICGLSDASCTKCSQTRCHSSIIWIIKSFKRSLKVNMKYLKIWILEQRILLVSCWKLIIMKELDQDSLTRSIVSRCLRNTNSLKESILLT